MIFCPDCCCGSKDVGDCQMLYYAFGGYSFKDFILEKYTTFTGSGWYEMPNVVPVADRPAGFKTMEWYGATPLSIFNAGYFPKLSTEGITVTYHDKDLPYYDRSFFKAPTPECQGLVPPPGWTPGHNNPGTGQTTKNTYGWTVSTACGVPVPEGTDKKDYTVCITSSKYEYLMFFAAVENDGAYGDTGGSNFQARIQIYPAPIGMDYCMLAGGISYYVAGFNLHETPIKDFKFLTDAEKLTFIKVGLKHG